MGRLVVHEMGHLLGADHDETVGGHYSGHVLMLSRVADPDLFALRIWIRKIN